MKNQNTYLNVHEIRKDFPILNRKINGKSLVYFDNAATAQTPKQVIDVIVNYYSLYNANIHRGVHQLSQEATDKYEELNLEGEMEEQITKTPKKLKTINFIENVKLALRILMMI